MAASMADRTLETIKAIVAQQLRCHFVFMVPTEFARGSGHPRAQFRPTGSIFERQIAKDQTRRRFDGHGRRSGGAGAEQDQRQEHEGPHGNLPCLPASRPRGAESRFRFRASLGAVGR